MQTSSTRPRPAIQASSPIDGGYFRIHDLSAFPDLQVDGLGTYPDRAAVLPGTCVVQEGVPRSWLQYLQAVGIGARRIIEVRTPVHPGEGLAGCFSLNDLRDLRLSVIAGHRLEFFLPTQWQHHYVERLGYDYRSLVWGPNPELATQVNDKIWLRRTLPDQPYPEYRIVNLSDPESAGTIRDRVGRMIIRHGGAVLKHPNLASGDGIKFVRPTSDAPDWTQQLTAALTSFEERGYKGDIIIDAFYKDHVPLSAQMEIGANGPRYICATVQQISNGTVHSGNFISSRALPGIDPGIVATMKLRALEIGWELHALGYHGYFGADFLYTLGLKENRLLLLETNGRVTGAMYPLSVALQAHANGLSKWGVGSDNIALEAPSSFERLSTQLGPLMFNGTTGVVPACPRLLVFRKAMLYAVGRDVAEAKSMLAESAERLAA